ncbi:MAG: reverse transcriptase/maturase family protein [Nanoarchaeota archaeon]
MKARKNKTSKFYVKLFEENLEENLREIQRELESQTYEPTALKKFIIRDPKTRVIRKSIFKDRIVHHAIVNVLEPIYEKIFIFDSYANRKTKGTLAALERFSSFKRRVTKNGKLISYAFDQNSVIGYVFKADIKHFFDSVDHNMILYLLGKKIRDKKVMSLIYKIIKNFDDPDKGMPLGNMTSQFFANVYLNCLDYFVKHHLKMKYYVRYVDDFVILHESKEKLEECKDKIAKYLRHLRIRLHPDKSKIFSLYKGVTLLGFKEFYLYRIARKRNVKYFKKRFINLKIQYKEEEIGPTDFLNSLEGWFGYIMWGNTYNLRREIARNFARFAFNNKMEIKRSLYHVAKLDVRLGGGGDRRNSRNCVI